MPSHHDKDEEMYAITSNAAGDQWRVNIHRGEKCHRRVFNAARHGGAEAALVAAKAWRDETVKALLASPAPTDGVRLRSNNTSGATGVKLTSVRCLRDGRWAEELTWNAFVIHGKQTITRSFPCARHGNEKAFELAVQARQQLLECLPGFRLPLTPPALVPGEHEDPQMPDLPLPAHP